MPLYVPNKSGIEVLSIQENLSGAASIDFINGTNGFRFNDDFDVYEIWLDGFNTDAVDNGRLYLQIYDGASLLTTIGQYMWTGQRKATTIADYENYSNDAFFPHSQDTGTQLNTGAGNVLNGLIEVHRRPAGFCHFESRLNLINGTVALHQFFCTGRTTFTPVTSWDGFRLTNTVGDFIADRITVRGKKTRA